MYVYVYVCKKNEGLITFRRIVVCMYVCMCVCVIVIGYVYGHVYEGP